MIIVQWWEGSQWEVFIPYTSSISFVYTHYISGISFIYMHYISDISFIYMHYIPDILFIYIHYISGILFIEACEGLSHIYMYIFRLFFIFNYNIFYKRQSDTWIFLSIRFLTIPWLGVEPRSFTTTPLSRMVLRDCFQMNLVIWMH